MLLAIDVGNTNVMIGCVEGEKILNVFRMETNIDKTDDEYAVSLALTFELNNIDRRSFDGAILSSVVPPMITVFKRVIKRVSGLEPLIVGSGIKTGLDIRLDNPAQMGSDLVDSAVAASEYYSLPAIIIDMGTATTVSVLDAKGRFLGGTISPGPIISLNALTTGTSQLPRVTIEPPKTVICTNTPDCMKSGIVYGTAAMIDGMISRIEEELGETATVIATGPVAEMIIPYCRREIIYDGELLLKGLSIIYEKNTRKRKKKGE